MRKDDCEKEFRIIPRFDYEGYFVVSCTAHPGSSFPAVQMLTEDIYDMLPSVQKEQDLAFFYGEDDRIGTDARRFLTLTDAINYATEWKTCIAKEAAERAEFFAKYKEIVL